MQRTPGAPSKESRSRRRTRACREEEEDEASAALAASFSSMRLRDEPPAKRICLASMAVKNDEEDLSFMGSLGAASASSSLPQTPPRRQRSAVNLKLDFEEHDLAESAKSSWRRAAARSPSDLHSRSSKASPSIGGSCMKSSFRHPSMEPSCDRDELGSDLHDEGLSGLHALETLFSTGSGRDRSCSRLLIFED